MVEPRAAVDPLIGTNYATWKIQMRMVLMKMGVWGIVEGTEVAPRDDDTVSLHKSNERKDRALATIVLAVKTNLLYLLGDPKDPVQVWSKLSNQFQKKTWANKLTLRRKLNSLKLKDQEPVQDYIKSMIEVFDELAVIGDAIDEEDRVVQTLANLPDSYSMLVTALEANAEVPKLELVTERLLHEERKMKERASSSNNNFQGNLHTGENALLASNKTRSYPKTCYYCGETGHIKAFCDKLKKKINEEQENKKTEVANFSFCAQNKSDSYYSDDECIALVSEVVQEEERSKWIIDSAAGSHMCKNGCELENLRKLKRPKKVKVGNGQHVIAHREGTVKLLVKNSGRKIRKVKLHNVLFVPELQYNLFSVAKAADLGKKVVFGKTGCDIIDSKTKEVIGSAIKVGKLYHLRCASSEEEQEYFSDQVYRSNMKKAIISLRENTFHEEMMRRLTLLEEKRRDNSYTFKEESNKNLEDQSECNIDQSEYNSEVKDINLNKEDPEIEEPFFQEDPEIEEPSFQEDSEIEEPSFQEDTEIEEPSFQEDPEIEEPFFQDTEIEEPYFQEDPEVDETYLQEDLKTNIEEDVCVDKRNFVNNINFKENDQNKKLREQISVDKLSLCSASPRSTLNEMSITNRQCYLINMLFKDLPVSSMTILTPMEELD